MDNGEGPLRDQGNGRHGHGKRRVKERKISGVNEWEILGINEREFVGMEEEGEAARVAGACGHLVAVLEDPLDDPAAVGVGGEAEHLGKKSRPGTRDLA